MNKRKFYKRILAHQSNVRFDEFVRLVESFGFRLSRATGSHHIFTHPELPELLNLQEIQGEAKPYQIKQWIRLVERYNLEMEEAR